MSPSEDIILVTADSVRHDFAESLDFVSRDSLYTGIAAGHYTRPSLAALHSSRLRGSLETKVLSPSFASALSDLGYTTIGLVPTPQADPTFNFDEGFDYYDNYLSGAGNPARNRRGKVREFLGSFDIVRQIYRRVYPMEANMDDLPDDGEIIEEAISRFQDAAPPRFLWVHLMGSHRPYGTGDDAIPNSIDRKAEAAGGRHWFGSSTVTDREQETILAKYRAALGRIDEHVTRLLSAVDSDPLFVFTSDHGDEFGEEEYYYHQGYRRRVAEPLIEVPVVSNDLTITGEYVSLIDLPPTILSHLDASPPPSWQGKALQEAKREEAITIAPWHDKATVAWQDFERKIVAQDADTKLIENDEQVEATRREVSEEVERQLKELGYRDGG